MRRSELPAQGVRGRASGVVAGPLCVRCRCCVSPVRPAGLVSYLTGVDSFRRSGGRRQSPFYSLIPRDETVAPAK